MGWLHHIKNCNSLNFFSPANSSKNCANCANCAQVQIVRPLAQILSNLRKTSSWGCRPMGRGPGVHILCVSTPGHLVWQVIRWGHAMGAVPSSWMRTQQHECVCLRSRLERSPSVSSLASFRHCHPSLPQERPWTPVRGSTKCQSYDDAVQEDALWQVACLDRTAPAESNAHIARSTLP
jgi:hypothetical protein